MVFKPWDERKRTRMHLQPDVQGRLWPSPGVRAVAFQPAPLPGAGRGLPVQFVIGTTETYDRLNEVSQAFLDKAMATGMFVFMDTDLKIDKPQTMLDIDRDKAAQLGLTMRDVGSPWGRCWGAAMSTISILPDAPTR